MKHFKIPLLESAGTNTGKMKRGFAFSKTINEDGSVTSTQVPEAHITIFKGRYEEENENSHSLRTEAEGKMYHRVHGLNYEGHHVYYFNTFAKKDDHGIHVGMTWKQRQKFHLMQNDHWIQKSENIQYIVNILFLSIGVWLSIWTLLKTS